ncbi:unnamed protein product [Effrenium voratum]|uniref:Methyltransferase type 11 domain-containing protein n=1 Tax=Effrenium voratum TaxID=2562239 RepID=A0AA36HNF5_9DINO|nr:unnamed protein product [Effrenium voratum]
MAHGLLADRTGTQAESLKSGQTVPGEDLNPEILSAYREAASWALALGRDHLAIADVGAGVGRDLLYIRQSFGQLGLPLQVVAVEPNELAWPALQERLLWCSGVVVKDAAELSAGSFDLAVLQQVLCSADAPQQLLAELRGALKPGGGLLFVEHMCSSLGFRLLRPLQWTLCGCDLCRDPAALLRSFAWQELAITCFDAPVLGVPLVPHIRGLAIKAEVSSGHDFL